MQSKEPDDLVLLPQPAQRIAVFAVEDAFSSDHVVKELALEYLSVDEEQLAIAVFVVVQELALVFYPVVIHILPVAVVERDLQRQHLLVVKGAHPAQLIVLPVSLVRYLIVWIVQHSLAVHLVLLPRPDVLASFRIVEDTFSMSHSIQLRSLVSPSEVSLRDVLQIIL